MSRASYRDVRRRVRSHGKSVRMALVIKSIPDLHDDDALARLSRAESQWHFELDADGSLIVSPTFSEGGARELEAGLQLYGFAKRVGGKAFGSSAGFRLPDNSVRSPDAAWMSSERIASLTPEERTKFWRTCPDVVIEILSDTDVWDELLRKLDLYERNGARYAVGIDPSSADFLRVARRRMDLCWTWMRFSTRKGCTVWLAIGRQRSTRAVYNSYGGEGKGRSRRPARRNSACASPSVQLSLRVSISAIDEQPFVTDSAANRLRRHLRIGDIFLPKNS